MGARACSRGACICPERELRVERMALANNVNLLRYLLTEGFDRKLSSAPRPIRGEQARLEQVRRENRRCAAGADQRADEHCAFGGRCWSGACCTSGRIRE